MKRIFKRSIDILLFIDEKDKSKFSRLTSLFQTYNIKKTLEEALISTMIFNSQRICTSLKYVVGYESDTRAKLSEKHGQSVPPTYRSQLYFNSCEFPFLGEKASKGYESVSDRADERKECIGIFSDTMATTCC